MTQHDYDYDLLRRQQCIATAVANFNLKVKVDSFICDDIETGDDAYAMLFRSGSNIYALLVSRSEKPQTLADVRERLKSMGLTAEKFLPPYADESYFYHQALAKLEEVYPARQDFSIEDVHFYTRYAEYNPALVKIDAVSDGVIKRFNAADRSWQEVLPYSFRKVEVAHG